MSTSHKRGAGGRQNIRPNVVARASGSTYYVLRRTIHHLGDAEYMVARGESQGDGVALFWHEPDAIEFADWKNQPELNGEWQKLVESIIENCSVTQAHVDRYKSLLK